MYPSYNQIEIVNKLSAMNLDKPICGDVSADLHCLMALLGET